LGCNWCGCGCCRWGEPKPGIKLKNEKMVVMGYVNNLFEVADRGGKDTKQKTKGVGKHISKVAGIWWWELVEGVWVM